MSLQTVIVNGLRVPVSAGEDELFRAAKKKLEGAGFSCRNAAFAVYRRSVDARHRDRVAFVCSVAATGDFPEERLAALGGADFAWMRAEQPVLAPGDRPLSHRPVVIGTGPAGMFAAYLLAAAGYRPLVLERGGTVEERASAADLFTRTRVLDPECNIQYGAGGAGTFSDGKLVSRVNDPLTGWLFGELVRFGAPREILTQARPHVGTDYLRRVVANALGEITRLGGEVRYHAPVTDFRMENGRVTGVVAGGEEIPADVVLLAPGNSARDTFRMLMARGVPVEAKPFSVGLRIEHLQAEIDEAMYGSFAGDPRIGHAEYHLSYDTANRGVYTFCMCPGGVVVAAASEYEGVVVNGMSDHERSGKNANSAVVCSVKTEDFGGDPVRAMALQREIEHGAYVAGGGDYGAPLVTVGDFLAGKSGSRPGKVQPTYMNGEAYRLASPETYLPGFVIGQLRDGIRSFGRSVRGFDAPYAILSGAETRTSSPLRILRGENRESTGVCGLYPCGEGAGYAGGITSAAIDGVRTAMAVISVYRPLL